MERIHYKNFSVAGFSYYEGVLVFNKLKIGTKLTLRAEPDNKYDPLAVAIYYKRHKLGFVPRNSNYSLAKLLGAGHRIFETRVQYVDQTASPEDQLGVVVFIKSEEKPEQA
ncbi:HIRAN domain-containing protein [Mangrovibacterium marinum]|uniref:HIRAN domain-containing protein n=1 Tax=Mangrovibacterium marinum TaxID=1639118 RepID=A0A2T5C492_9BACT|nr:HIRAN domain-containing protein [Mangrovibacterium marinum]PTN09606.1 HIRAN domain-containing protein [Mangrovibacterium marinum]